MIESKLQHVEEAMKSTSVKTAERELIQVCKLDNFS